MPGLKYDLYHPCRAYVYRPDPKLERPRYLPYFWVVETQRQKKIAGIIQQDLAEILQRAATDSGMQGTLISVTKVSVTVDLSIAKVYVSIFPSDQAPDVMGGLKANQPQIRHELAQRARHQFRRMPELFFYLDDSLDYIDKIDKSLKGGEDPIDNPDLLPRRKKS